MTHDIRQILVAYLLSVTVMVQAGHHIYSTQLRTLQAVVNQEWMSAPPILRLGSDDVLNVSFDDLSHDYHRYTYRLERCEADWQPSEGVFENDWLEGFNNNIIDDYETSINTIIPYTHYRLQLPNDLCRLKLSGNYRLHILDDEEKTVATVDFMITEQTMNLALEATTNTDIDLNQSHQQLSATLDYGSLRVTKPEKQIRLVLIQNGRDDNLRQAVPPTHIVSNGLKWSHCRQLIFDAGNEYHKYEVLDTSHPTMGIDYIHWDGTAFQVFPFTDEPRPNYIYDQAAHGAFYIRNSDNRDNDITGEYVYVNYRLRAQPIAEGTIIISGHWTNGNPSLYTMTYDDSDRLYHCRLLQKQGYYSYQYLWLSPTGEHHLLPSEGSYYQTQNRYQALVYYKAIGERTWRLTAFRGIDLASSGGF